MRVLTTIILLICFVVIKAQTPPNNSTKVLIKGIIKDADGFPIEYANILLTDKNNQNQVFGDLTNQQGYFEFSAPTGSYGMLVELIGYHSMKSSVVITKDKNFGTIVLKPTVVELQAAQVNAQKPLYRIELDKKVYDMENDPASKGLNLTDALENVPSVQVDADGTISLRGNAGVRILINGKPSSMVGISGTDALQNIPAETVKRVEVITSPSARYDASGQAGIINIVLKKGANQGFNGSFGANLGYPQRAGINANLNYKTEQWNFFTNSAIQYSKNIGGSEFVNRFFDSNQTISNTQTQTGDRIRKNTNYSLQLGTDYSWNDNNNLLLSARYSTSNGNNERPLFYEDFNGDFETLTQTSNRIELEDEDDKNFETNLSYKHTFNEQGHQLTADIDYSVGEETEIANITENLLTTINPSQTIGLQEFDRTYNQEKQSQYLVQADYVLPFKEKSKFELGFRNNFRNITNDFKVEELDMATNQFNQLDGFTDDTKYEENILAIYSQYGNGYGKFSFLAGLRMESSDVSVNSLTNNTNVNKNYTDWFPSLNINYEIAKKHELQFSYTRRISRPRSRWLIPFFTFSDDRNTFIGNQNLDPTYTNQYEATYIGTIGKLTITPSIYYSFAKDRLTVHRVLRYLNGAGEIIPEIPENTTEQFSEIFVAQPINTGTEERYGLDLNLSYRPYNWWRLSTNLNVFRYQFKGFYQDPLDNQDYDYSGDDTNWTMFVNNNLTLPGKVNFQTTFFYRGKQADNRSIREPIYALNFSLNKDLFNNNATITFNVRDVLNTRRRNIQNFDVNYTSDIQFYWSVRTFNLNFTYRINQKKKKERQRQEGAGGDDVSF